MAICLITLVAARFLHLCACFTFSSVHVSTLHPLLAHHFLCYVYVYCVFYLIFVLYFVTVWLLLYFFDCQRHCFRMLCE